jgi:DNA-binding MarR family transcriptional regulator
MEADVSQSCTTSWEVFGLIDAVAKSLKRIHSDALRLTGLTPAQYQLLAVLWRRDSRPLKELADVCGCRRATITGLIDGLENRGLVERVPNPEDRRSALARLTSAGRQLRDDAPSLEGVFGNCCRGLTREESMQLCQLLNKLGASLTPSI